MPLRMRQSLQWWWSSTSIKTRGAGFPKIGRTLVFFTIAPTRYGITDSNKMIAEKLNEPETPAVGFSKSVIGKMKLHLHNASQHLGWPHISNQSLSICSQIPQSGKTSWKKNQVIREIQLWKINFMSCSIKCKMFQIQREVAPNHSFKYFESIVPSQIG